MSIWLFPDSNLLEDMDNIIFIFVILVLSQNLVQSRCAIDVELVCRQGKR